MRAMVCFVLVCLCSCEDEHRTIVIKLAEDKMGFYKVVPDASSPSGAIEIDGELSYDSKLDMDMMYEWHKMVVMVSGRGRIYAYGSDDGPLPDDAPCFFSVADSSDGSSTFLYGTLKDRAWFYSSENTIIYGPYQIEDLNDAWMEWRKR